MNAWNDERTLASLGFDVPQWIDQEITPSTLAAIEQGGCASGAYMPAVTYHTARETMGEHGDNVLALFDEYGLECGAPNPRDQSWSDYCCYVFSVAVEIWAAATLDAYREQHGGEDDD